MRQPNTQRIARPRASTSPGNFYGLDVKNKNQSAPKIKVNKNKGISGPLPAPAIVAKALGINAGMPIHQSMAARLVNHPDTNVAAAAKRLMAKY